MKIFLNRLLLIPTAGRKISPASRIRQFSGLIVLLGYVCLLGGLGGCSKKDALLYKCKEYTVVLPQDWKKNLDWGIFGDLVSVTDPQRRASINFTIIEVSSNTTLDDVLQETLHQLHIHVLERGYSIIDGKEAVWFKAIGAEQIILVHLVRKGNRVYSIMGSTLPGNYDRFKDVFVETARSLKFVK